MGKELTAMIRRWKVTYFDGENYKERLYRCTDEQFAQEVMGGDGEGLTMARILKIERMME